MRTSETAYETARFSGDSLLVYVSCPVPLRGFGVRSGPLCPPPCAGYASEMMVLSWNDGNARMLQELTPEIYALTAELFTEMAQVPGMCNWFDDLNRRLVCQLSKTSGHLLGKLTARDPR